MPQSALVGRPGADELDGFVKFCSALTLSQGHAFELEPFQLDIVGDYFDGVRETLALLPKKNGKTTLMAALALYHVASWAGRDPDCVVGAASREQASIMWDQAAGFIRRSPGLQKRMIPKRGYREIRSTKDSGRIRVMAADVDTADGVIPTLALVDELGRHKKPDLYGVFRDGLGPRGGQMLGISTAGDHAQSPLGLIRNNARKLPGTKVGRYLYARAPDNSFALHEWGLAEDDDLDDLELVKMVNPASWQTIEQLRQRHDSPSMMSWQWARLACGVWLTADVVWITPQDWYANEVDDGFEMGDRIVLGFDGSRFHDATALVGCRIEDGLLQLLGLWEHPGGADEWEVPANEVDALLGRVTTEFKVVRGYFDPPLWQTEIDGWARDFGELVVQRFPTNRARMITAVERFRTDLVGGKVPHVASEDLTRHILNAQLKETRGGYWLVKGRGQDDWIDAGIATVLAYEARMDQLLEGDQETKKGYAFL